jgi:hypothetical protein
MDYSNKGWEMKISIKSLFLIIVSYLLLGFTSLRAQVLTKSFNFGIVNDSSKDSLTYTLIKTESGYDGSLNIISSKKDTLWEHSWEMAENDINDILMQSDVSIKYWVENFFNSNVDYTCKVAREKLNSEDLQKDYIDFYAKKYSLDGSKLLEMILSDSSSVVLQYRATWREDLILIVFVPELGKFIEYSGGDY